MYTTRRNFSIDPRAFGGLIENVFQGANRHHEEANVYLAPVNIHETDNNYEVHLIAPGLKKEDFKINLDQNILNISYEHKDENKEQAEGKWLRSEYRTRSFKRSFTLNEKIDATAIAAKYNDGILVVTLPKKEVEEPTAKEITVG